jgi:NAD(P)-dependent dehydrogenase (short-subunit alcohol dehydrogenase family)
MKTVLITGASAGMGREIAIYLAKKGYIVYAAARRIDKLESLVPLGIHIIPMDVTDELAVKSGVDQVLKEAGSIDILINNAGFGAYGAIEDVHMEQARYQLEVNVLGAARLIQLVLPAMRSKGYGKIVNISSIGGKMATILGGWYHASKFALEGLSDSLRNEVKQFGIDVIVIEPGGIKSEWGGIAFENLQQSSVKSVYKPLVDKVSAAFKSTESKNPEPLIIAKLVYKAVTAPNPRTRYVAGYMAKPALFMRKLLSDKMMDKLTMSQINKWKVK